jgi:2-methylcitrate dehydratase PrpD
LDNVVLAGQLVEKYNIKAKEIKKIVETTPGDESPFLTSDYLGPFTGRYQAIMSSQFSAAAVFLRKPIGSSSFWEKNYNDPEVAELAKKVELVKDKSSDVIRFEVTLNDGSQYNIEGHRFKMTLPNTDEVKRLFAERALGFLGKKKTDEVVDIILNLERIRNIKELTRRLE